MFLFYFWNNAATKTWSLTRLPPTNTAFHKIVLPLTDFQSVDCLHRERFASKIFKRNINTSNIMTWLSTRIHKFIQKEQQFRTEPEVRSLNSKQQFCQHQRVSVSLLSILKRLTWWWWARFVPHVTVSWTHESCLWLCSYPYTLLGWQRTKFPIKNESYLHIGSVSSTDQHITDRIDLSNGCGLICFALFSFLCHFEYQYKGPCLCAVLVTAAC